MTTSVTPYLLSNTRGAAAAEYMDEYMAKQPNMLATFEKHAAVETAFFKECGLMCKCDEPVVSMDNLHCAECKLPLLRLTVLFAEKSAAVPDGMHTVTKKKAKR